MALEHSKPRVVKFGHEQPGPIQAPGKTEAARSIERIAREMARGFPRRLGRRIGLTEEGMRLFGAAGKLLDESR